MRGRRPALSACRASPLRPGSSPASPRANRAPPKRPGDVFPWLRRPRVQVPRHPRRPGRLLHRAHTAVRRDPQIDGPPAIYMRRHPASGGVSSFGARQPRPSPSVYIPRQTRANPPRAASASGGGGSRSACDARARDATWRACCAAPAIRRYYPDLPASAGARPRRRASV